MTGHQATFVLLLVVLLLLSISICFLLSKLVFSRALMAFLGSGEGTVVLNITGASSKLRARRSRHI